MSDDQITLNIDTCPICFDDMNFDNRYITNCDHKFCNMCLEKWFDKGKISCPNCRIDIKYLIHMNNKVRLLIIQEKIIREIIMNQPDGLIIKKHLYVSLLAGNIICLSSVALNIYLATQCEF